jgi:hypothetical protein
MDKYEQEIEEGIRDMLKKINTSQAAPSFDVLTAAARRTMQKRAVSKTIFRVAASLVFLVTAAWFFIEKPMNEPELEEADLFADVQMPSDQWFTFMDEASGFYITYDEQFPTDHITTLNTDSL